MKYRIFISSILLVLFAQAQGQPEEGNVGSVEVNVVDQYKASIKEASKISNQPGFTDTTSEKLPVNYSINPQMLSFDYSPSLIQPARVSGVRLGKLPVNMVRLGIGNYGTALGEVILSNSRSKGFNWNVGLRHFSSNKGVKEIAFDKSPFMENELILGGKWVLKDYRLKAQAGVDWNSNSYYGIPKATADAGLMIPGLEKNAYQRYFGNVQFQKVFKKSGSIFQKAGIGYHYFTNNWATSEQLLAVESHWLLPKEVEDHIIGAELNVDWQSTKSDVQMETVNQLNVQFFPKAIGKIEWFNYTLGLNFNFYNTKNLDSATTNTFATYFYPEIAVGAELVRDVLSFFAGWTGDVKMNSIYNLTQQNPFMLPVVDLTPTGMHKIYGGLEGAVAKNISYKLEGSANYVRSMPLFYRGGDTADITVPFDGKNIPAFQVVYVRGSFFNIHGELTYNSKNTEVSGWVDFYDYALYRASSGDLGAPYHLPTSKIGLDIRQNIKEKIVAKAGLAFVGGRKALDADGTFFKSEMKNVFDVRLGAEYNINNNLSASLDFANLASQEYDLWLGYPAQRIRVMLSLMYKF